MKTYLIIFSMLFAIGLKSYAQQADVPRNSIKWNLGFGLCEGKPESGFGLLSTVGFQRSYGARSRWRLNPGLLVGYMIPPTDVANRSFALAGLNMSVHYDLLKYKIFSLVTSGSVFSNYTGGKTRPGYNYTPARSSFNNVYFGGGGSMGFRVDDPVQRRAFEIRLINVQAGTNQFVLGYVTAGLDFKLSK